MTAVMDWLPRWNADSLAQGLGPWAAELQPESLPGHDTISHFVAVLVIYILAFIAVGAVAFCRRDVAQ
jgi:ABC-type transport system involved in multi-copper enzyme maturation permease subunit